MNFLLISSVYSSMSTVTGRPSSSSNHYCTPRSHFLHTKWVIMMLIRLSLSLKAHFLFFHANANLEICFITEIRMVFDSLTDGLLKSTSLSRIWIVMKLQNLYLIRKQAKILWFMRIHITERLERSVCWDNVLWISLGAAPNIVTSQSRCDYLSRLSVAGQFEF